MAEILTQPHEVSAEAANCFINLSAMADAAARAGRLALRRARLSFRAVNLPGAPGYDPGLQRHHLLPRQLLSKRCFITLFERVGGDRLGFDDFRANGLLLPANDTAARRTGLPLHRGPHRDYNAMVIERVGQVEARWSRMRLRSPQAAHGEAVAGLRFLQQALRRRLLDPGDRRLALNRFDPLSRTVEFQIEAMVDALWADSPRDEAPWPGQALPCINAGARIPSTASRLALAC